MPPSAAWKSPSLSRLAPVKQPPALADHAAGVLFYCGPVGILLQIVQPRHRSESEGIDVMEAALTECK